MTIILHNSETTPNSSHQSSLMISLASALFCDYYIRCECGLLTYFHHLAAKVNILAKSYNGSCIYHFILCTLLSTLPPSSNASRNANNSAGYLVPYLVHAPLVNIFHAHCLLSAVKPIQLNQSVNNHHNTVPHNSQW
jgi:hypothetical protein